jgi:hypothetical protein
VVWRDGSNTQFSNVMFARSTDDGATFSTPAPISGIPGGNAPSPPQIATDSSGSIHVLARGMVPTGDGHFLEGVFYAHSSDGGATFSVTPITNPGETYILWAPVMAVSPNTTVNILWRPLNPSVQSGPPFVGSALSVSRSTDRGATFSRTAVWNWPNTPNAGSEGVDQIVVDANENIYVAWDYCLQSQPCNLLLSRSTDQGKAFSAATTMGSGANPEMIVDPSGNLNLAWTDATDSNISFTRSTDQGATFSTRTEIPAHSVGLAMNPAVDANGHIFIGWTDPPNGFLSRSSDGGATFSPASNPAHLTGVSGISVDSHNNLNVIGSSGNGPNIQVVLARSTDGGDTFSQVQISNDSQHMCPTPSQMALEKDGNIDAVWEQFASPFGATGVQGCDSAPNQVLFSRGVVPQPDFTISTASGTQTVLPGGAAKFNLTLTASGGFSDSVNLSCSKLPAGAECAFDSSSIDLNSPTAQTNVTVTTPPTIAQSDFTFTISAASGSISHTQDVQLGVGGITGSITPSSAVIAAGSSGNFDVTLASTNGFAGPVTLVCAGAPTGMDCGFNPPQPNLTANARAVSVLTVKVAAKPSSSTAPLSPQNGSWPTSRSLSLLAVTLALLAAALLSVILRAVSRCLFSKNRAVITPLTSRIFSAGVILSGVAADFLLGSLCGPRGHAAKNPSADLLETFPGDRAGHFRRRAPACHRLDLLQRNNFDRQPWRRQQPHCSKRIGRRRRRNNRRHHRHEWQHWLRIRGIWR